MNYSKKLVADLENRNLLFLLELNLKEEELQEVLNTLNNEIMKEIYNNVKFIYFTYDFSSENKEININIVNNSISFKKLDYLNKYGISLNKIKYPLQAIKTDDFIREKFCTEVGNAYFLPAKNVVPIEYCQEAIKYIQDEKPIFNIVEINVDLKSKIEQELNSETQKAKKRSFIDYAYYIVYEDDVHNQIIDFYIVYNEMSYPLTPEKKEYQGFILNIIHTKNYYDNFCKGISHAHIIYDGLNDLSDFKNYINIFNGKNEEKGRQFVIK